MAWSTNPYCTLAQVKEALGRTTTTDDTYITSSIPRAQADIDKYLGYKFQEDTGGVRIYRGNDIDLLRIEKCLSVTSVIEGDSTDITDECELYPYNSSPAFILERANGATFDSYFKYTITGNFGYTAIPADIEYACILLTIHYVKLHDAGYAASVQSQSANAMFGIMKYPRGWPKDVCDIIERNTPAFFVTTGL